MSVFFPLGGWVVDLLYTRVKACFVKPYPAINRQSLGKLYLGVLIGSISNLILGIYSYSNSSSSIAS